MNIFVCLIGNIEYLRLYFQVKSVYSADKKLWINSKSIDNNIYLYKYVNLLLYMVLIERHI